MGVFSVWSFDGKMAFEDIMDATQETSTRNAASEREQVVAVKRLHNHNHHPTSKTPGKKKGSVMRLKF